MTSEGSTKGSFSFTAGNGVMVIVPTKKWNNAWKVLEETVKDVYTFLGIE